MKKNLSDFYFIKSEDETIVFHIPSSSILKYPGDEYDCRSVLLESEFKDFKKIINEEIAYTVEQVDSETHGQLSICVAETCNLRCKYCYANGGTYDSTTNKILEFEDYKKMIEGIFKIYPKGIKIFNFFGGEPLLGFEGIKQFVPYAKEYYKMRGLPQPIFTMVTNGTLINNEIFQFLKEHRIAVTISIDGPNEVNDKMRVFKDGRGVGETVSNNISIMKDRNFNLYAEATITEHYLKDYKEKDAYGYLDWFYDIGFDSVGPCMVEYSDSSEVITNDIISNLEMFCKDLVDYCFDVIYDDEKCYRVNLFVLSIIRAIVTKSFKKECRPGKISSFMTTEGDLYPCQLYYQARKRLLGNIYEDIKDTLKIYKENSDVPKRKKVQACTDCFSQNICQFWCAGSSLLLNGTESTVVKTRCIMQKTITENVIRHLAGVYGDEEQYKKFKENLRKVVNHYSKKNILMFGNNAV